MPIRRTPLPKPVRVLKYLMEGHTIETDGRKWAIHDGRFGVIGYRIENRNTDEETQEELLFEVDFTVADFIRWANEDVSEEQLVLLGARNALVNVNKR